MVDYFDEILNNQNIGELELTRLNMEAKNKTFSYFVKSHSPIRLEDNQLLQNGLHSRKTSNRLDFHFAAIDEKTGCLW